MDNEILYKVIDHLDSNSFFDLIYYLLKQDEKFSKCTTLSEIDNRIIENPPERFYQIAEAFFINFYPYSIYKDFCLANLNISDIKELVLNYCKNRTYKLWLPVDGTLIYVVGNYDSRKINVSDDSLLDFYKKELSAVLPPGYDIGIGNINTIIGQGNSNLNNNVKAIKDFILTNDSGICINLSDDKILATRFIAERTFDGIITSPEMVFQPVFRRILDTDDVLTEFNKLINDDTKESVLEEFLLTYHSVIFGNKYDTVSTQIWLNFPEYDIGEKKRRLDMLMRNSISNDWDIFELKRSSVKLTKTKSDVPIFVSAVYDAIAQLRNYRDILNRDSVKRYFEKVGIKYYNPQFNLVIGKKPLISKKKWDWLLSQQQDLNILTYDDLFDSAKKRLTEMKDLLSN